MLDEPKKLPQLTRLRHVRGALMRYVGAARYERQEAIVVGFSEKCRDGAAAPDFTSVCAVFVLGTTVRTLSASASKIDARIVRRSTVGGRPDRHSTRRAQIGGIDPSHVRKRILLARELSTRTSFENPNPVAPGWFFGCGIERPDSWNTPATRRVRIGGVALEDDTPPRYAPVRRKWTPTRNCT